MSERRIGQHVQGRGRRIRWCTMCSGGLRETMENPSQARRSQGRNVNPPECGLSIRHDVRFLGTFVKFRKRTMSFVMSVCEICALLGCYAASSGNPLPTFRDNVSVPSSRFKKSVSVRPSAGTTQLPQDGFSLNLLFDDFSKICQENLSFIKIWQ